LCDHPCNVGQEFLGIEHDAVLDSVLHTADKELNDFTATTY
jgi:hypothetical protein